MPDYDRARAEFSWAAARAQLAGLPRGGLNIAHEAVDRYADGPLADTVALRFLSRRRPQAELTYADLKREADRFANVLTTLGVKPGERVFVLAGRIPELYVAALGTLKHGSVFCPLFSAFGPEPIEQRLRLGDARVLVTTTALYRRKVAELRWRLPRLAHVLLVGDPDEIAEIPNIEDFRALMGAADAFYEIVPTAPGDMALLHFTSGTTGTPKGAIHVHEAVVAHRATGQMVLDLRPGDVFWCTADPGWVTGTSYGIIAPLTIGATAIVDEAELEVDRWYGILQDQRVTVWYTAPTALRMLMRAGGGGRARIRPGLAAVHRERRRAAQPGGGRVGRGGVRDAGARQLVADRDRRDHDRQLPLDGRTARFDGTPVAGDRGVGREARRGRPLGACAGWDARAG
jgi:acetyl-CoA synthetase